MTIRNGRFAKFFELWPVFLLACVYSVSYFSPDYFITPILVKYQLAKPVMAVVVGGIGFLEMLGGYFGWSGLRGLVERWLEDDIEFVKQLKGEQKTKDFVGWLKVRFARKYIKFMHNQDYYYDEPVAKIWLFRNIDKIFKWITVVLKSGGYATMFIFGTIPFPGFRVIPDILCGTTRWKAGFMFLAIGNFLKTLGFIYGWSLLLS